MANHNALTKPQSRTSIPPSFLTTLPLELRLEIYTHLLTTPLPLHGLTARGTTKYNIHTAILRTCRQIHFEARHVFFGRNTFAITPVIPRCTWFSSAQAKREERQRGAVFDPPLQPRYLSLIRHMEIDILYYPKHSVLGTRRGAPEEGGGWYPISPEAEAYVGAVAGVLDAVKGSLRTLRLSADMRRIVQGQYDAYAYVVGGVRYCIDPFAMEVNYQKYITGFHFTDGNAAFGHAVAGLKNVGNVEIRFEFEEICFGFTVGKEEMGGRRLVVLADKVFKSRGQILEGHVDRGDRDEKGVVVLNW